MQNIILPSGENKKSRKYPARMTDTEGNMQKGKASIIFDRAPYIFSAASIVGQKEGEGPLGSCFEKIEADPKLGQKNREAAERELQRRTALHNL